MNSTPADSTDVLDAEEEAVEENSTDRLLFLSDGVFAIVITLLVLEIKVPHVDPAHHATTLFAVLRGFVPLWPSFLGYVLSFVTVGIMWTNHCILFRYIKKNDHLLTILNSFLLLIIAFVPFVTAVLADYLSLSAPYPQAAVVIYTVLLFFMALSFNLLWRYASRDYHLLDTTLDPRLFDRISNRYRYGPLIYLTCCVLSFFQVILPLIIIGGLALFYSLPYGKEIHAIEQRLNRLKRKPRR